MYQEWIYSRGLWNAHSELASLCHCSTMINENRTSLLRSGTSNKKPTTEKDLVMELWQNYVILACAVAQKGITPQLRCASPDPGSVLKKNSKTQKSVSIFVDWLIHICIGFPIYFANFESDSICLQYTVELQYLKYIGYLEYLEISKFITSPI